MPQETNLNVAPYFDDFDPRSNHYKVLFKPAYPIQARELNNLQSILQDQIEKMGTNIFKEGSVVIPGAQNYNQLFHAIQIQPEFLGIPVELYLDQLLGKKITGRTSGITAEVVTYITNSESTRGNYTIYVNYLNSSSTDNSTEEFFDNEVLETEESISFASTFIAAGEGFANTVVEDAAQTGSAFVISEGVFFIRGHFVTVPSQLLILDQYDTNPSFRVGLNIREQIITSDADPQLTDNASGFNNYAAPGADRLSITATLSKKNYGDYDTESFIQLAEIENGILRVKSDDTKFNLIGDELAKRTFEESGNYYIKEFVTTIKESLNNQQGNRGIYEPGQITQQGSVPSDDLMVYKVSPGKAYVKGFEVSVNTPSFIDIIKPRTTRLVENQSVNFAFGPTLEVNNVYGSPIIGFNTTTVLSLRDQRVGSSATEAPGTEIGLARVYDFALESGSYNTSIPQINQWDLSLFDLQTYTNIDINIDITLDASNSVHIEGEQSGANAFLRYDVNAGTALTAYSKQGEFIFGERLKFNGVLDNSRFVTNIDNRTIADVKSVFIQKVGTANTFSADVIQSNGFQIGIASITASSNGVSTITSPSLPSGGFAGIATVGNLLKFSVPENENPTFVRITSISGKDAVVAAAATVNGVNVGKLPTTTTNVTDLTILTSKLQGSQGTGNFSSNASIYSALPKKNIQSVNIRSGNIIVRDNFDITIDSNGDTQVIQVDDPTREFFLPFDEERYSLIRQDGTTENLTRDKFVFTSGSTQLQIKGLGSADSNSKLIATIKKLNPTSKIKLKQNNSIIINRSTDSASGTGTGTLNDGLSHGLFPYGTRVQDSTISLNVPDVIDIYGIFESNDTIDPKSPSANVQSLNGPSATTNDLVIGEIFIGKVSGAKARYIERLSDTSIGYIYVNDITFEPGEQIEFSQSSVTGSIGGIDIGSKNVTRNYTLAKGQKNSFYDFSRIIRKGNFPAPTRKLKVYFTNAYYQESDDGDITTINSYNGFDYTNEIGIVDGKRVSDIIDARPRVTSYTTTAGTRSPLEFFGRNFNGGQHSSSKVIASDESLILDYNYYLGRADRVYVNKNGSFSVKYGAPDDIPTLPDPVTDGLNIANVFLPAYLYNVNDARLNFIDHKRYQMIDIAKIEQRVKNLEYYTSLNTLEQSTLNSFVPDVNGLNRLKSGIFVDNFTNRSPQDDTIGIKNSIDSKRKILRPAHYTTAVNLQLGIGNTVFGTGFRRTGNVITLDYNDTSWLVQPYATRIENVTPFLVNFYQGSIELEPSVDVWVSTNQLEVRNVLQEGSFQGITEALGAEIETTEDGERIGVAPVVWDSWETVGAQLDLTSTQETESLNAASQRLGIDINTILSNEGISNNRIDTARTQVNSITLDGSISLEQTRTGSQQTVNEVINTESLGNRVVNREIIHFMRSRNIQYTARKLKPFTRMYSFFDGVDVNKFTFSKLIEIEMTSGTFSVGETVDGVMQSSLNTEQTLTSGSAAITFRTCVANHKYGAFNSPTDVYDSNPYDRNAELPTSYTQSSTILNVDTNSLQSEEFPEFAGYIQNGMILRGRTSGAEARVTSVRMITDRVGTLIGSFNVPDGSNASNPVFETGRSSFKLTSSSTNSRIQGATSTSAEEIFYSQGDLDNTQEVTLSLRNSRVSSIDVEPEDRFLSIETTTQNIESINARFIPPPPPDPPRPPGRDPLAQTFFVDDETGIYLSRVELFFQSKATDLPVVLQIRETRLGTPTDVIVPLSEVILDPNQVNISEDGTTPTSFVFPSPVYLNGKTEYALVVLSDVTSYNVWISRLGEADVTTLATEAGQIIVTEQPLLGSLFKSQNASVWTPSQYEDLKFNMYRCNFSSNGVIQFFNPQLPTKQEVITRNGISINNRTIKVGLGTTINNDGNSEGNNFAIGVDIFQNDSDFTGVVVGLAGSATGDLTITNAGVGYTPSSGQFTHTGIGLTSLTGAGIDATANITTLDGVAIAATINSGGSGYNVADVLVPIQNSENIGELGRDMQFSVGILTGFNEVEVSNVQGELKFTSDNYLRFTTAAGITSDVNVGTGGSVFPVSPIRVTPENDGLHIKVFQRNHGMYSNTNRVELKNIASDITPTALSAVYSRTSTDSISVGTTANLADFEGLPVSTDNPGYVKIGSEIISYTGTSGNSLTGTIGRGVDNTIQATHALNELVFRYEFGGVSLRRINKEHQLSDVTISNPIDIDSYHVKVDMSQNGVDRSSTNSTFVSHYFENKKTGGGIGAKGSYNIPYSIIIPNLRTTSPNGSAINASVRTISETSVDGVEVSFLDKGYQEVALNQKNYFESQRALVSPVNERTYLTALPGNKSLTLDVNMNTSDVRLSPAIDLDHASVLFISNRANAPVANYATDSRVNSISLDPNSLMYVTKNIVLENPATSLRVFIDGYVSDYNDIRMFYALGQDLPAEECIFTPFPGINNTNEFGRVVQPFNSDGGPDIFIPKSDVYTQVPSLNYFKEYKFTIDNLDPFQFFRIKLIGTSTNQAVVPQFRNLRVIAAV